MVMETVGMETPKVLIEFDVLLMGLTNATTKMNARRPRSNGSTEKFSVWHGSTAAGGNSTGFLTIEKVNNLPQHGTQSRAWDDPQNHVLNFSLY